MDDSLLIDATTRQYLLRYPKESGRLDPFLRFLEETQPGEYAVRTNKVGHVTTSGFLISEAGDALLLIYHLKLQRCLQPGGHVENDATLLESALREIREEVGIAGEGIALCQSDECPIDIDPHRIPARKDVPEHWHFDFRFLFTVTEAAAAAVECQAEEVALAGWFAWDSAEVRSILPEHVLRRLKFHQSI